MVNTLITEANNQNETNTMNDDNRLVPNENWQTQQRGSNSAEYEIYASCVDKDGLDIAGQPLKTYEEWLGS
jgi:hypothetical protein